MRTKTMWSVVQRRTPAPTVSEGVRTPSRRRPALACSLAAAAGILLAAALSGCTSLLLAKGYPAYRGTAAGLPISAPVQILRDSNGIPHIYAQNRHDLLFAEGYVHAQDRLWQMESIRRAAAGTLTEVAGPDRLDLDYFCRALGLPELRRRAAAALGPDDRAQLQAYVDGVNAYIASRGDSFPLEFGSAGIRPAPWSVEELFSFVVLNSWMFRENYRAELLAVAARERLSADDLKELFPGYPGARLPDDAYFEQLRSLRIGEINRSALAFFQALPEAVAPAGGSNIWVTKQGPGGKPLLANDTHVGISLPGTWYLCDLHAPGIDITGASAPGVPGVILGHTRTVAWGMTILPVDFVDLFVVRVDPQRPTRYLAGDRWLEMEREELTFRIKGGGQQTRALFRTLYGPVITKLEPGVDAAVALHWYGTLGEGELADGTMHTVLGFMDCSSVQDVMRTVRSTRIVGLNFVAADGAGHIGWQSVGAVPLRAGYSGRLPADGSSGAMRWTGFVPADAMPSLYDPPDGLIVNSNDRVTGPGYPEPISNSWAAPYRHDRIVDLLSKIGTPSVDSFRSMQSDVHSLQADRLLPKLLAYSFDDPKSKEALDHLARWDRSVSADSRGAAVWEVFITELVNALIGDELGPNLFYYHHVLFKQYLVQDVILDRPESALWDRTDTPMREGPREILDRALRATIDTLERTMGTNRSQWSWGRLHTIEWRHPGATSALTRMLLNIGPFPLGGDGTTVDATTPVLARGEYGALHIPNLRFVVPLGDLDAMEAIAPPGQSGQPGQRHYDDMVRRWLHGELVAVPSSLDLVRSQNNDELILTP